MKRIIRGDMHKERGKNLSPGMHRAIPLLPAADVRGRSPPPPPLRNTREERREKESVSEIDR